MKLDKSLTAYCLGVVERSKKNKKIKRRFSFLSIVLFVLGYSVLILFSLKNFVWFAILLVLWVLIFFVIGRPAYNNLQENKLSVREVVVLHLISIANNLEGYLRNPTLSNQNLLLIKKSRKSILNNIGLLQSAANQQGFFDESIRKCEVLLVQYLQSDEIRKVVNFEASEQEILNGKKDFLLIANLLFQRKFDEVVGLLSKRNIKNSGFYSLFFKLFSTENVSSFMVLFVIGCIILSAFSFTKSFSDSLSILSILVSIIFSATIYSKFRTFIQNILDFIYFFFIPNISSEKKVSREDDKEK